MSLRLGHQPPAYILSRPQAVAESNIHNLLRKASAFRYFNCTCIFNQEVKMLARKGIFTTPSIMQPYVSTVRAPARVTCIARHLHILYHISHTNFKLFCKKYYFFEILCSFGRKNTGCLSVRSALLRFFHKRKAWKYFRFFHVV